MRSAQVASLFLGSLLVSSAAEPALQATRTSVEQWVQTRQLISRTRADWDAEREILQQTKVLLERELATIDSQMGAVSTNSTQVDKERAEAEADLRSSEETLNEVRRLVGGTEERIRGLIPRLPAPLVELTQPLTARLPSGDAAKVPPTERVQTAVSILNEIDKFNNAVTLFSEKRKNDRGEEVSVETVYLGLGAGFFVNPTGDFAGSGTPGASGWEWKTDPAMAGPVRDVLRMYRGEKTAAFVPLTVTIR